MRLVRSSAVVHHALCGGVPPIDKADAALDLTNLENGDLRATEVEDGLVKISRLRKQEDRRGPQVTE